MQPTFDPKFEQLVKHLVIKCCSKNGNNPEKLTDQSKDFRENSNINLQSAKVSSESENAENSDLTNLFQEFKGDDNTATLMALVMQEQSPKKEEKGYFICLDCKMTFKNLENFDRHKSLCEGMEKIEEETELLCAKEQEV